MAKTELSLDCDPQRSQRFADDLQADLRGEGRVTLAEPPDHREGHFRPVVVEVFGAPDEGAVFERIQPFVRRQPDRGIIKGFTWATRHVPAHPPKLPS